MSKGRVLVTKNDGSIMGLYTNTNQFKTDVCTSWLFNANPHIVFHRTSLTDTLSQPFLERLLKVSIVIQKAWPIFFGRYPFCEQ